MKYLALLLILASPVAAWEPSAPSISAYSSTMTITGVSISSSIPTSVLLSTSPQYRDVCIQNPSTYTKVFCGETITFSTTTGNETALIFSTSTIGVIAAPYCLPLLPGQNFYCMGGANGTAAGSNTRITVIKGR